MDVLVIGASGLVGSNVAERFGRDGFDVVGTYRTSPTERAGVYLDKTDPRATAELVGDGDPDVVVDTAAFHDVDACETRRDRAWSVNAAGTRNVAAAAGAAEAHLLYLSTDYVFGGDSGPAPYVESDPVSPRNYYGASKYAGETAAGAATDATILRPSVVYGASGRNFMTWLLDELAEDRPVQIADDQVGSPTHAPDLAEACLRLARRHETGLFHAGGSEPMSRYAFARQIATAHGYDPGLVTPVETETLGQRALRPQDSSLDSTKLYRRIDHSFRNPAGVLGDG
jgi:dTDP-4-dehydrorhamnose reductase